MLLPLVLPPSQTRPAPSPPHHPPSHNDGHLLAYELQTRDSIFKGKGRG